MGFIVFSMSYKQLLVEGGKRRNGQRWRTQTQFILNQSFLPVFEQKQPFLLLNVISG